MSSENRGSQYITYDYKHPAKGKDFNTLLCGGIVPGVYEGGTLNSFNATSNTVTLNPFIAYVRCIKSEPSEIDRTVRIQTYSTVELSVSESHPLITISYTWADDINVWADFDAKALNAILTHEVPLGRAIYTDGVLTGFDLGYPYRATGHNLLNPDFYGNVKIHTIADSSTDPALSSYRSRGTTYNKTAVRAEDRLFGIYASGRKTSIADSANIASIQFWAHADWTDTSTPSYITFSTCPINGTARLERVRITQNGNIGIGTATNASNIYAMLHVEANEYLFNFRDNINRYGSAYSFMLGVLGFSNSANDNGYTKAFAISTSKTSATSTMSDVKLLIDLLRPNTASNTSIDETNKVNAITLDGEGKIGFGLTPAYKIDTSSPSGQANNLFRLGSIAGVNNGFYASSNNSNKISYIIDVSNESTFSLGAVNANATFTVYNPNFNNATLTWNSGNTAAIRTERSELAFGMYSTFPYATWMQVRNDTNGSGTLLINPLGGKIGIGVTDPQELLHLNNPSTSSSGVMGIRISHTSWTNSYAYNVFYSGTPNYYIGTSGSAGLIFDTNSTGRMRIGVDGNISINTELDNTSQFKIYNSAYTNSFLVTSIKTTGVSCALNVIVTNEITTSGTDHIGISIGVKPNATNNYGLYIYDTLIAGPNNYSIYNNSTAMNYFRGNLGIGRIPTATLDVAGNIRMSNWYITQDANGNIVFLT